MDQPTVVDNGGARGSAPRGKLLAVGGGRYASVRTVLLGVGLMLLVGVSFLLGKHRAASRRVVTGLEVSSDDLDFGEVWVQEEFQWTLPIKNRTSVPIEILDLKSSCGCVGIAPRQLEIPPGEVRSVQVTLDLRPKNSEDVDVPVRDFAIRVLPIVRGTLTQPDSWTVHGKVRNPFTLSTYILDFGGTLVSGMAFEPKTVTVVCDQLIHRPVADFDDKYGSVHITPKDGSPRQFQVTVLPRDTLPVGAFGFPVTLHGVDSAGKKLSKMQFGVSGTIVRDALVTPNIIPIHDVTLGESVEQVVVVGSRTGKLYEVVGVGPDVAGVVAVEMLDSADASRGDGQRVRLRLTPLQPGTYAAKFALRLQPQEGDSVDVPLRISCCVSLGADDRQIGGAQTLLSELSEEAE